MCHAEPVFAQYCGSAPVPTSFQLHGWIDDSVQRVRRAAAGDEYQSDLESLLPVTAGSFFNFYSTAEPSVTISLQRALNAKATSYTLKAAIQQMKEQVRHSHLPSSLRQRQ